VCAGCIILPMKPLAEEDAARRRVFVDGRYKPFGELTSEQVSAHAAELGQAAGLGHGSRVGPVSAAWKQLAMELDSRGAARVSDLDAATVATFAERLWILPPGGELLTGGPTGGR
jgi:hypothetical protein